MFGGGANRTFDCNLCSSSSVASSSTVCNCSSAITEYTDHYGASGIKKHKQLQLKAKRNLHFVFGLITNTILLVDPFTTWLANSMSSDNGGQVWRCDYCMGAPTSM